MRGSLLLFLLLLGIITGGIAYAEELGNFEPFPPEPTWPPLPIPTEIGGQSGWVSVDSDPSGAAVSFDGINQGDSPVTIKVPSMGTPEHEITIEKAGYQPWFQKLNQNPENGQTIPIHARLVQVQTPTPTTAPYGWITVQSIPSGGSVSYDGVPEGTTPVTIKAELSGKWDHVLSVSLPGYQTWRESISQMPDPGETIQITASLQPLTPKPTETVIEPGYGWISIDSAPQGATVRFDNDEKGTTPVNVKVYSTGNPDHIISISLPGYQTWSERITENPASGETIPVFARLQTYAGAGTIAVQSNPSNAVATLDNLYPLTTPCTFRTVSPGIHTITITNPGYRPYSTSVQVNPGIQSSVSAALVPVQRTGIIQAESTPSGADIYIDRMYRGQTPETIGNIAEGNHDLTLRLAGYEKWTSTAQITANQVTNVHPVLIPITPEETNASLKIASSPSDAQVYLQNTFEGMTPQNDYLDITDITPGSYTLRLEKPGYANYTASLNLQAGKTVTENISLTAARSPAGNGTLMADSLPSGADVLIDNLFRGITPCTISDVIPGDHTVLFRMNGYKQNQMTVHINAGETTPVSAHLSEDIRTPSPTEIPVTPAPASGWDIRPVDIIIILAEIAGICIILGIVLIVTRKNGNTKMDEKDK